MLDASTSTAHAAAVIQKRWTRLQGERAAAADKTELQKLGRSGAGRRGVKRSRSSRGAAARFDQFRRNDSVDQAIAGVLDREQWRRDLNHVKEFFYPEHDEQSASTLQEGHHLLRSSSRRLLEGPSSPEEVQLLERFNCWNEMKDVYMSMLDTHVLVDLPCLWGDSIENITKIMLGRLSINQVLDKNQHKNALQSLQQGDDIANALFTEGDLAEFKLAQLRTRAEVMNIATASIKAAEQSADPEDEMRALLMKAQERYVADNNAAHDLFVKTARRGVPLITTDLRKKTETGRASQPFILAFARLKRKQPMANLRQDAGSKTNSEFAGRSEREQKHSTVDVEIEEMYKKWDQNKDGLLDKHELLGVIKELLDEKDHELASELADEFIKQFDINHKGTKGIPLDNFTTYWKKREQRTRFVFLLIQDEREASGAKESPSAAEALAFFLCEQAQFMCDGLNSATDAAALQAVISTNVSAALPEMVNMWQPDLVELCREVGTAALLVDFSANPDSRRKRFLLSLDELQEECQGIDPKEIQTRLIEIQTRVKEHFKRNDLELTKASQVRELMQKRLSNLPHKELRKAIIRMSYYLELELDEDDAAAFMEEHRKSDSDKMVEAAVEMLLDQYQKQPYVDALCGRERIKSIKPGRGNRKTIRTNRIQKIDTHESSGTLVRELLPDDRNPQGSFRGRVAWTFRVQSMKGFEDTWQDRQQANVACRAGAIALIIVDDEEADPEDPFTPEHIDPACDIPVVAVPHSAAKLLEEFSDPKGNQAKRGLKLAVNGGRSRYLERVRTMLKGLPPDAMLKKTNWTGKSHRDVEMPLVYMGANPLLDWRLLESVVLETFQRYVPVENMRSTSVKARSVEIGRAIYEAVLRLAPTPDHFTGFWLASWSKYFDPLCIALDRHNIALARALVTRLSESSERHSKEIARGTKARAQWIHTLQEGSPVARIDRDGNADHSGRILSRVNDNGEYKVAWSDSAQSEWVHLSQLEEPHSSRLEIKALDNFRGALATQPSADQATKVAPASVQSLQSGPMLHVRGVGGQRPELCTPYDLRGTVQKQIEEELHKQFEGLAGLGTVKQVTLRHRVEKEEASRIGSRAGSGSTGAYRNTSWALVTMADAETARQVLDGASQLEPLTVTLFDQKVAKTSRGSLRSTISMHNIKQHTNSEAQSTRARTRWSVLQKLLKSKQLGRGKLSQPLSAAVTHTSMTLATAPNMIDNFRVLYKRGLGAMVDELMKEHSIIDAAYEVLITQADLAPNGGILSAGSMELNPTHVKKERVDQGLILTHFRNKASKVREERQGIDWSDFLHKTQYHNREISRTSTKYFPDVKPQILGVRGAARAGDEGLLAVLVEPYTPISAFSLKAVEMLINHKWKSFGRTTFFGEVFLFAVRIITWQTLAMTIAEYGTVGTVASSSTDDVGVWDWRRVVGVLMAANGHQFWIDLADMILPLFPRSPHYLFAGQRIGWWTWNTIQGWEVRTRTSIHRFVWHSLTFSNLSLV
jgi:hypothetical protein